MSWGLTMNRPMAISPAMFVLLAAANVVSANSTDDGFQALHRLILPDKGDSQWLGVSWQPATNIWAAREKAAREGKPIFLWYMAGEPLGPC